ncbi:MAG TPA: glycosyltransferase, partial [Pseudonocardia sp.]|nr:glycosyltransferase [Pseudonocardia sp.]
MTAHDPAPLRYLLLATHVPASGAGGGMVRYAVETATALARRPDVELHVLVTAEAVDFFGALVGRERVHVIRSAPTAVRSLAERYLPLPAGGRFDVVHGAKHLLPRRTGGATAVLTVHDMLPLDRPGDFGALKRVVLRFPYLASARGADLLVCASRATRARLLDYAPGLAARAAVVPLAPGGRLLDAAPVEVPALAGRPFALVVGDASARKNLALVVDAWPQVRRRH